MPLLCHCGSTPANISFTRGTVKTSVPLKWWMLQKLQILGRWTWSHYLQKVCSALASNHIICFFLVGPFVYTFASQASEDTGTCSPAPTNPATTTKTILLYLRPCRGERQLLYKFEPNLAEALMAFQRHWHSESPCAIFGFRCPNHLHHYPNGNLGYTLKIGLPNTKVVFQPLRWSILWVQYVCWDWNGSLGQHDWSK